VKARPDYLNDLFMWTDWGLALAYCGLGDDQTAKQALQATLQNAVYHYESLTFQWLCLPIAAILSARDRQPEHPVELLGLAYAAPPELTGWMKKWSLLTDVRQQLESELGGDMFKAAWERGQASSLEAVVRTLLEDDEDKSQPETVQDANQSLTE